MTIPGGFAEYVTAAGAALLSRCRTASTSPPPRCRSRSASPCTACGSAASTLGQRVLVLGAGTIGLAAVIAARAGGAGEILVTARRPQQRAAAKALGADRVLDDADDGRAAEAALRVAGRPRRRDGGRRRRHARRRRRDLPSGRHRSASSACSPSRSRSRRSSCVAKELRIQGSMVYNRVGSRADFEIVQDMLARDGAAHRRDDRDPPLPARRRSPRRFRTAADKTSGSIKVTITARRRDDRRSRSSG